MFAIVDIIFLVIVAMYALRGLFTGLISSSISILSKAAALFLAIGVTPYIHIAHPFWNFWGIILFFLLLTSLFRFLFLKKNDEKISLHDRLLGMIIGGLDAVFVGFLISYFMFVYPYANLSDILDKSVSGNFFLGYLAQARSIIPF